MSDTPQNAFDAHRSAFSAGLRAAFSGLRVAGRSPEVRTTYAQLVAAIFVLSVALDACGIWAVWHFTGADPASAWWIVLLLWTLRVACILLVLLLAPLIAFSLVNTFFPMLSERVFFAALRTVAPERAAELQAREGRSFVRGMADNLVRTAMMLALALVPLLASLVPVAGAVAGPALGVYFSAPALAWELLDPYFDKQQLDFAAQRRFVAQHRSACLGFGLPLGMLMAIPLVGPLMFGLAQAAAAVFVAEVLEQAPRA